MKQRRNTKQKMLVLEAVQARGDHPTADQVFMDVRAADNKISRGTVYRNLSQLSDMGEINHIKIPGADRFDRRRDMHYHLICTKCGKVCDALADYSDAKDREVAKRTGYTVIRHRTVFEGICPDCQKKEQGKV